MADPEKVFEPSPADIRAAESSMDHVQREMTEVREDALFEGRRQAMVEREDAPVSDGSVEASKPEQTEVAQDSPINEETKSETAKVDVAYLEGLGIRYLAKDLFVLRSSGECDDGWYIFGINPDTRIVEVRKNNGNPDGEMLKRIPFDEAEQYIKTSAPSLDSGEEPTPEPEGPKPTSPEVRHNFRNIPMRDGRIAYGEVIFESPNMITIMTPQGKMDIYRSSLLHPSVVYTMGDAEDLAVLDAYRKEEQKKRDEEQEEIQRRRRNQTPPRQMSAGA